MPKPSDEYLDTLTANIQQYIVDLEAEVEHLRAEVKTLSTPTYYWDDRNLDYAVAPEEVAAYDDPGDIIEVRPIHELPTVWALVTPEGVEWFMTCEAAEAAKEK